VILFFDTETYPIRPGRQAPRVVCVQSRDETGDRIELREAGLDRLESALLGGARIVGHNVAFDAACTIASRPRLLPLWLDAYTDDRVTCTELREKLLRIAQGTAARFQAHGLMTCLERHKIPHMFEAGDKSKGPGSWRTRYAELDGLAVDLWPEDARRYALADLDVSALYEAQEARAECLRDEHRQARAGFSLYLQRCRGMRTDARAVAAFARKVEIEHEDVRARLQIAGLVRSDGSKNTKRASERMRLERSAAGLPIPLTKTGRRRVHEGEIERAEAEEKYTALDADACAATGDEILIAYARYTSVGTLRRRAERLALAGEIPIQPFFDVLKNTGRTSSSMGDVKPGKPLASFGDQVQNLNREPGLRECYVARPGYVLVSVDWRAAELHSLSQVCTWLGLGSDLGAVLNSGRDAHMNFGAHMRSWEYEWAMEALQGSHGPDAKRAAKEARQGGKAANFGFPGGLGVEKFRLYAAKTYGVILTDDEARELRAWWFRLYSEMGGYFQHINALLETGQPLRHFMSDRLRGDLRYTSAANSYFQGHTADMAKHAGWSLTREFYGADRGPLNEARPWNFVHDEYIAEVPIPTMHDCAARMVEIMETSGRLWCPDAPPAAEPAISYRWRKGAEPTYDETGRLIPYEDRTMHPETAEKIREALDAGADPIHLSWAFGFEEERIRAAA